MPEPTNADHLLDAEINWLELRAAGMIDPEQPSPFDYRRAKLAQTPSEAAPIGREQADA
jgi:hypothetical protein